MDLIYSRVSNMLDCKAKERSQNLKWLQNACGRDK